MTILNQRLTRVAALQRATLVGERGPELRAQAGWFRIDNRAGDTAEIYIYDEIGWSPWGDTITAAQFVDQLNALDVDQIDLHVNSPGGDVFDGIAIYNALLEHDAKVHVLVDGLAASAASFIAQAGDQVTMAANSQMMIHDAFGVCVGTADDMAQMAALLDRISGNLASLYATRTGQGDAADWRTAMKAETWYNADEAVNAGLADDIARKAQGQRPGTLEGEASARWDLSGFRHAGRDAAPAPTIRPADRHAPGAGDTIPVEGAVEPAAGVPQPPAAGTGVPAPEPEPEVEDPWADLPDDAFDGIGFALDEALADELDLDPDVVRTSIGDAYHDAPAPPPATPPAQRPLTHIDIDEFVTAIQEGLTP